MVEPYIVNVCGHTFEKAALMKCLMEREKCPLCNKCASIENIVPNYSMKAIVDKKRKLLLKQHSCK